MSFFYFSHFIDYFDYHLNILSLLHTIFANGRLSLMYKISRHSYHRNTVNLEIINKHKKQSIQRNQNPDKNHNVACNLLHE